MISLSFLCAFLVDILVSFVYYTQTEQHMKPMEKTEMWFEKLASWIEKRGGMRELYRKDEDGSPKLYMRRYYLVKSKYFELMLHQFFIDNSDL